MKKRHLKKKKRVTADKATHSLTFEVPEFEKYDRSLTWYGIFFLIFATVIVTAVFLNDLRLALIILLASIVFYQSALTHPEQVTVILSDVGLVFKNRFYAWEDFKSFTLFGTKNHLTVHLEKLSMFSGPLVVPLPKEGHRSISPREEETDPDIFMAFLRSVLPERLHAHMNFNDWLNKTARF